MSFKPTIGVEEIDKLQLAEFKGEIFVIEEISEKYTEAIEYLKKQKVIGFDTETKPCFHVQESRNKVALLQLSGEDRAFIFRLTSIGLPTDLCKLLSNSRIVKVGAAVHDDIRGLQHYNRFIAKGFVDLQSIGQSYGIKDKSVRKMAAIILGLRISKSQQLSNWESPHLTPAQVQYAAIDAWACKVMYSRLINSAKIEEPLCQ